MNNSSEDSNSTLLGGLGVECFVQNKPLSFQVIVTVNLVIASIGIIFNFLCLCVFLRKRMISFSFNFLLICLTTFDLLVLIRSVINGLNNLQLIYLYLSCSPLTDRAMFLLAWIADGGTKYFTVAISFERYIVLCYPLKARTLVTRNTVRIGALIVMAWTVIILPLISFFTHYHQLMSWNTFQIFKPIVLNFLPFGGIILLNLLIYIQLVKSRSSASNLKKSSSTDISSTSRMLLTVVFVFIFCFSYETFRRVFSYFVEFNIYENNFHFVIQLLSDIFYILNSSINFLIYYLMGTKFRSEFMKTFGWDRKGPMPKKADLKKEIVNVNQTRTSPSPALSSDSLSTAISILETRQI